MKNYSIKDVEKMFPLADRDIVYMFHEMIYDFLGSSDSDTDERFHHMLNSLKMAGWKCQECKEDYVVDSRTGICTKCNEQNVLGG